MSNTSNRFSRTQKRWKNPQRLRQTTYVERMGRDMVSRFRIEGTLSLHTVFEAYQRWFSRSMFGAISQGCVADVAT